MNVNDQAVFEQLYNAVARYVEMKGGSVVVAGGVEIQSWPGEGDYKFRVAVHCTGRKPPTQGDL